MSSEGFLLAEIEDKDSFIRNLRLDMTPEELFKPCFPSQKDCPPGQSNKDNETDGFMFYVDSLSGEIPTLVLMKTRKLRSSTVGDVEGVPPELLKAAVAHEGTKDYSGMYPIDGPLTTWIKEQLQITT